MNGFIHLVKSLKTPAKYLLYFFIAYALFNFFFTPPHDLRDEIIKRIGLANSKTQSTPLKLNTSKESIKLHIDYLAKCTDENINFKEVDETFHIFSMEKASLSCLLSPVSRTKPLLRSKETFSDHPTESDLHDLDSLDEDILFSYDSLIDGYDMAEYEPGKESPDYVERIEPHGEYLVKLKTGKVFVFTSKPDQSFHGIGEIKSISNKYLLVKVTRTMLGHRTWYLVSTDSEEATVLSGGTVEVVNLEKLIFKSKGHKSYWEKGGAFWFDKIIDKNGKIIKIDNSRFNVDKPMPGTACYSKNDFIKKWGSELPASHQGLVCVDSTGYSTGEDWDSKNVKESSSSPSQVMTEIKNTQRNQTCGNIKYSIINLGPDEYTGHPRFNHIVANVFNNDGGTFLKEDSTVSIDLACKDVTGDGQPELIFETWGGGNSRLSKEFYVITDKQTGEKSKVEILYQGSGFYKIEYNRKRSIHEIITYFYTSTTSEPPVFWPIGYKTLCLDSREGFCKATSSRGCSAWTKQSIAKDFIQKNLTVEKSPEKISEKMSYFDSLAKQIPNSCLMDFTDSVQTENDKSNTHNLDQQCSVIYSLIGVLNASKINYIRTIRVRECLLGITFVPPGGFEHYPEGIKPFWIDNRWVWKKPNDDLIVFPDQKECRYPQPMGLPCVGEKPPVPYIPLENDQSEKDSPIIKLPTESPELQAKKEEVRQNPNDAYAHASLGATYQNMGLHKEAIASYKEAIRIDLNIFRAYAGLGFSYEVLGQHQEAISSYKEAVRIKPGRKSAHEGLGRNYEKLGQYQEAIASYKKVLRLNPDHQSTKESIKRIQGRSENDQSKKDSSVIRLPKGDSDDSEIDLEKSTLTTIWWGPRQKKAEGYTIDGERVGEWRGWYRSGEERYIRYYENGKIIGDPIEYER